MCDATQLACGALGDDHPVARHALCLTDRNMSEARRKALRDRKHAIDAALAEELLRSSRGSATDASSADVVARQQLTPVRERVWALRNVAVALASGSLRGRAQARELLEQALDLQRGRFAESHPALTEELWRCARC